MPHEHLDPNREHLPVPRWEIRQMITDAIREYDSNVCGPKLITMQASLTTIENLLRELKGMARLGRWAGATLLGSCTVVGGIYAVVRITGHS